MSRKEFLIWQEKHCNQNGIHFLLKKRKEELKKEEEEEESKNDYDNKTKEKKEKRIINKTHSIKVKRYTEKLIDNVI